MLLFFGRNNEDDAYVHRNIVAFERPYFTEIDGRSKSYGIILRVILMLGSF